MFNLKCRSHKKSPILVTFRILKLAKKTRFFDLLPGLARYTFPDYRAKYDGQKVDQQLLQEDIPLEAVEEAEEDQAAGNLSQQSFT